MQRARCTEVLSLLLPMHIHCHVLRQCGGAASATCVCLCAAVNSYLTIVEFCFKRVSTMVHVDHGENRTMHLGTRGIYFLMVCLNYMFGNTYI